MSARFAACCGSVNLMNAEHLDGQDREASIIVWRRIGEPDFQLYFLMEFPGTAFLGEKLVAVKMEDGIAIRLDAGKVKHRSVLIGGETVRKVIKQDGTFNQVTMRYAMEDAWDKGNGWAGFAWVPR